MTAGTNMKYQVQIPTVQFGFILAEFDGTGERAVEVHKELLEAYNANKGDAGLAAKDWNTALDSYINGNPMAPDTYYAMSPQQQKIIQELKKCFKRIKSKNGESEID